MSTVINANQISRTYTESYRPSYSKDPPVRGKPEAGTKPSFEEAYRADFRTYDNARRSNHEEMMRVMDPAAYREYRYIKENCSGTGNPLESVRFMMNWIDDKSVKDPAMERRYRAQTDALDALKERFQNTDFKIAGVDGGKEGETGEFSVTLTKEELHTLTYGTDEEKEALYKEMEDAMKAITEAEKEMDGRIPDFSFGIDTKAEEGKKFFGIFGDDTLRSESAADLFDKIMERLGIEKEDEEKAAPVLQA